MEIPQSPDDLTPEKLMLLLQEEGSVRTLHMTPASDTSGIVGHTMRLTVEYDVPTTAPNALIAKFPTIHEERRSYFSTLGMYSREVKFYQEIAADVPLDMPGCYCAVSDPATQQGFLLLEDLSPVETGDRTVGCSEAVAEQALATIAKLHIAWWDSPKLSQSAWLQTYNQAAFESQFHQSWEAFRTHNIAQLSDELSRIGSALSRNLSLLSRLWQPPVTLIHRDFNLDNLLFKDDRLYVIDWQLVRQGRAVFDVATFLCWNLQPDVRRHAEMRLLQHYHSLLLKAGIQDYDFEACLTDYRLAQLECLARIIAILGGGMVDEPHLLTLLDTILKRNVAAIGDWDLDEVLG